MTRMSPMTRMSRMSLMTRVPPLYHSVRQAFYPSFEYISHTSATGDPYPLDKRFYPSFKYIIPLKVREVIVCVTGSRDM